MNPSWDQVEAECKRSIKKLHEANEAAVDSHKTAYLRGMIATYRKVLLIKKVEVRDVEDEKRSVDDMLEDFCQYNIIEM